MPSAISSIYVLKTSPVPRAHFLRIYLEAQVSGIAFSSKPLSFINLEKFPIPFLYKTTVFEK